MGKRWPLMVWWVLSITCLSMDMIYFSHTHLQQGVEMYTTILWRRRSSLGLLFSFILICYTFGLCRLLSDTESNFYCFEKGLVQWGTNRVQKPFFFLIDSLKFTSISIVGCKCSKSKWVNHSCLFNFQCLWYRKYTLRLCDYWRWTSCII